MAARKSTTLEQARAVKKKVLAALASLPIAGVGITRIGDSYGVKVNLSNAVAEGAVPDHLDGVPIKTEVVGQIRKRDSQA